MKTLRFLSYRLCLLEQAADKLIALGEPTLGIECLKEVLEGAQRASFECEAASTKWDAEIAEDARNRTPGVPLSPREMEGFDFRLEQRLEALAGWEAEVRRLREKFAALVSQ